MHHDFDESASYFDDSVSVVSSRSRMRKTNKKKRLYEQYLADSGSDDSQASFGNDEPENMFEYEEFTVGMDINALIHQTVRNIIQSVSLEDEDGISGFGDSELICFAAALKHNSSIMSLQIRHLDVSDVSLVRLCEALEKHPTIRALDFSSTRGGGATSKAVAHLLCTNSSVIFARMDDTVVTPKYTDIVHKAVLYNALVCPDPSNNPFQLGLLRKISSVTEKEHQVQQGLQPRVWLHNTGDGFAKVDTEVEQQPRDDKKKAKKVGFRVNESSKFGGDICAQYVQGSCLYGSRCKYLHPERTAALTNSASLLLHDIGDSASVGFSASSTTSSRARLQSRLRPSHFTLRTRRRAEARATARSEVPSGPPTPAGISLPLVASLWTLSFTVMGCCAALALAS